MQRATSRVLDVLVAVVLGAGAYSLLNSNPAQLLSVSGSYMGTENRGLLAAGVAIACTAELGLSLRLLFGPTRADRGFALGLLAVLSLALVIRGLRLGWMVTCGCLESILSQSVFAAILRNVALGSCLAIAGRLANKGEER